MPPIEERLQQRFPHWFQGRRARIARPLLRGASRWSRFDEIDAFLDGHGHLRGLDFVTAALGFLRAAYDIDPADLARIPRTGRLLVVSNHPSGALDALALLDAIGRVRGDVRIVANDVLAAIEPLGELLLPVRVFGGKADAGSLDAIEDALREERCVVVFPAGEVSRLSLRGVQDTRWRSGFLHFARRTAAPVLPVRVEARNSTLFYGASALFKPAGTALLAREMFARRRHPLRLHVGTPMRLPDATDLRGQLREVRRALYRLGSGRATVGNTPEPLAAPLPTPRLREAIAGTERLGETVDGKQLRLARCTKGTPLLLELGRLREHAFRSVGEGTGRARDIDGYDVDYEHLLVWDDVAGRIAGGYRIARGADLLARRGLGGLYTASLFWYTDGALPRLAEGMELGRSFVDPDYRGGRSLDYLWQGIGAYLRRYPRVRYLFGAVSISAALPSDATAKIVAHYRHHHGAESELLAVARRPYPLSSQPYAGDADPDVAFETLKTELATYGVSVPMLYRQYAALCAPGGTRFLAFGVDPDFSDSIDGLVEVDLHRLRPDKAQRYLQPRAARRAA